MEVQSVTWVNQGVAVRRGFLITREPGFAAREFIGKVIVVAGLLNVCSPALGEIIYETDDPFGSPFGVLGFDVFEFQSVAVRFTPDDNYTLDRISVWL